MAVKVDTSVWLAGSAGGRRGGSGDIRADPRPGEEEGRRGPGGAGGGERSAAGCRAHHPLPQAAAARRPGPRQGRRGEPQFYPVDEMSNFKATVFVLSDSSTQV